MKNMQLLAKDITGHVPVRAVYIIISFKCLISDMIVHFLLPRSTVSTNGGNGAHYDVYFGVGLSTYRCFQGERLGKEH